MNGANFFTMSKYELPNRHGKRPMTIDGPLHVQSCDHGDERALHRLLSESGRWPDVERGPTVVAGPEIASFQVAEARQPQTLPVFIAAREFARDRFNPVRTIYLSPPFELRSLGNYPGLGLSRIARQDPA